MRSLATLLLWLCSVACSARADSLQHAEGFRLPFEGRWFVAQAGDTLNVNHHMSVQAQWYGIDFAKAGGLKQRALSNPLHPDDVADFYGWGAPVLAPIDGTVVRTVHDLPDNPLGQKDEKNPAGNHIVLQTETGSYVFLAHFQRRSIVVREGQHVTRGQRLGRCGNSGNSDFPHIHLHMQDRLGEHATGQNMTFEGIDVMLTGKRFSDVDWPLIRGLFVCAHRTREARRLAAGTS